MINQELQNLIAIIFSPINLDVHVSTKVNTFRIYKEVLGAIPTDAEETKKTEDFLYFSCFLAGLHKSKNYELAPQLPLNNNQCSSNPWK